jgi:hypothetical protein
VDIDVERMSSNGRTARGAFVTGPDVVSGRLGNQFAIHDSPLSGRQILII